MYFLFVPCQIKFRNLYLDREITENTELHVICRQRGDLSDANAIVDRQIAAIVPFYRQHGFDCVQTLFLQFGIGKLNWDNIRVANEAKCSLTAAATRFDPVCLHEMDKAAQSYHPWTKEKFPNSKRWKINEWIRPTKNICPFINETVTAPQTKIKIIFATRILAKTGGIAKKFPLHVQRHLNAGPGRDCPEQSWVPFAETVACLYVSTSFP